MKPGFVKGDRTTVSTDPYKGETGKRYWADRILAVSAADENPP
jgi:hypothetical protein